jgi:squalene-hopene/tetraprenyl-beta-curcumene cyclase
MTQTSAAAASATARAGLATKTSALRASGVPASDPHLQEALKYLERCQDLSSVNKLPWAKNSGGAVYSPDESKAGGSWDKKPVDANIPAPKLAPYGSMTYALISSYLALDLKADDPRVAAALAWATKNYQFEANPGMTKGKEKQGLYYYYRIMAKTFDLIDATTLTLPDGRIVDWRADLFAAIKAQAKVNGDQASWTNDADRWQEGVPVLVTSYVLRSLKAIHASL